MINNQIFIKLQTNEILYLRKNDWMESKSFSDPQLLYLSQTNNFCQIISNQNSLFYLSEHGALFKSQNDSFPLQPKTIDLSETFTKIACSQNQLLGINSNGSLVKINFGEKNIIQKLFKMSIKFIDLVVSNDNYYAISQDQQAWVWGKNAFGQLGLSDYEPRGTIYPLVSLQRFYISQIFTGQNYTCCLTEQNKFRQSVRVSERQSLKYNSVPQLKYFLPQRFIKFNSSNEPFEKNQRHQSEFRYNEDQEHSDSGSHSKVKQQQNKSLNENNRFKIQKDRQSQLSKCYEVKESQTKEKSNLKKKNTNKTPKSSTRAPKSIRKSGDLSYNKSKKHITLQSKLTPKSCNGEKYEDKQQRNCTQKSQYALAKQKSNLKLSSMKEQNDILKKQISKIQHSYQQKIKIIVQTSKLHTQKLEQKQNYLESQINSMQLQIKDKCEQNQDLFQLISKKNRIIEDITGKIKLLQDAIEQHQKTLTARDNEAEQAFLKQKQYQLHITKLENQIQKMLQIMNNNQKNKEADIYKKEMSKLSIQIKQKIDEEKQYYSQRIKSLERKFQEQKNLYQLEIMNLKDQIKIYKQKQNQLISRLTEQKHQNKYITLKQQQQKARQQEEQRQRLQQQRLKGQEQMLKRQEQRKKQQEQYYQQRQNVSYKKKYQQLKRQKEFQQYSSKQLEQPIHYFQNNSSICIDSPRFQTLQLKSSSKPRNYEFTQINAQKQIEIQQENRKFKQKRSIQERNKQNMWLASDNKKYVCLSPLSNKKNISLKNYEQVCDQIITKKNSKSYDSIVVNVQALKQKNEAEVTNILENIERNRSYISKSANKLFNLLQKQISLKQ